MDYADEGNLRKCLPKIVENRWKDKLNMLHRIIIGLNQIHEQNLIHCDFHDGNILVHNDNEVYISDLGLCRPVKFLIKRMTYLVSCHLWHLKFWGVNLILRLVIYIAFYDYVGIYIWISAI